MVFIKIKRSLIAVALFVLFALGGLFVSFLLLPFCKNRADGHRVVRWCWRTIVVFFKKTGLVAVDDSLLDKSRGRIIVANHPSLIDVVLLTALIPDVYSVAKTDLKRNVFIGLIVKKVMLVNDELVLDEAKKILSAGGNILIFPEGTRTPLDGSRLKLKRGAAQLAIRLGAEVAPVRIEVTRRILAKGQSILDMGEETVRYKFISGKKIEPPSMTMANRVAAIKLTKEIEEAISP